MPRKPIIRTKLYPYHITARGNNKENFPLAIDRMWAICLKNLKFIQETSDVIIYDFVLMNNHFHLFIQTPNGDIDKVMYWFMKKVTLDIQKETGRVNRIFGGRYKGCLVESMDYFMTVSKYILRNPVRAGLSRKAEEYFYSTYHYHKYQKKLPFRLELKFELLEDFMTTYEYFESWVNEPFLKEEIEIIRSTINRSFFKPNGRKKKAIFNKNDHIVDPRWAN